MSLKAMRDAIRNAKTEKPKPPPPKPVAPVKAEKPPAKPPNKKERRKAKVKEEAILGRYPDATTLTMIWDSTKGVYIGSVSIPLPSDKPGVAKYHQFTRSHPALHQLLREFWRKDFVPWAKANGIPIVQQPPVKATAEPPKPAVPPPTE